MSNVRKLTHENFEIQNSDLRQKIIREDRLNVEDLNCFLDLRGEKFKVLNFNSFGIAVREPYGTPEMDENFGVSLIIDNLEIAVVHLKFIRRVKENDLLSYLVFEVIGEPISMSRAQAVLQAKKIIFDSEESLAQNIDIDPKFKAKVYEVKDWLESLKHRIELCESSSRNDDGISSNDYDDTLAVVLAEYMNDYLPATNEALIHLIGQKSNEGLKSSIEFFREKLKHLIYEAPFSNRVYSKPLGYAGDYEMMNIIYGSKTNGKNLFSKVLNHYWVNQPAAQAVRNRANYLTKKISQALSKNPTAKFLSVACGPSMEWQKMISEIKEFNNCSPEIHLLDQDENALKHAKNQLKGLSNAYKNNFEFKFLHKAIKNVIAGGLKGEGYDLIYSAGLFDYFSDPVAQLAAHSLLGCLKPGGKLIIGNFNTTNPNSFMMNLALDWHLIYRSEDDIKKMFQHLDANYSMEKEDLEINLFCVLEKK